MRLLQPFAELAARSAQDAAGVGEGHAVALLDEGDGILPTPGWRALATEPQASFGLDAETIGSATEGARPSELATAGGGDLLEADVATSQVEEVDALLDGLDVDAELPPRQVLGGGWGPEGPS